MNGKRTFVHCLTAITIATGAIAIVAGSLAACGGAGFDPQSKIDSVRLLGVRADKPYAKPGETVTLEALVTDGRRDQPRRMRNYWIPAVCMNPRDDLYYLCFAPPSAGTGASFVSGGAPVDGGASEAPDGGASEAPDGGASQADGGAPSGGGGSGIIDRIPTGVDLGPFLPQGERFSFRMPDDAVKPRESVTPYGLAIVFNVLCAGRLILVERDPSGGPQQVPLQCVDEDNKPLPPSEYVIGMSRVYSYTDVTNTNPVVERVTVDGIEVDLAAGVNLPRCVAKRRSECAEHEIDVRVSDASWEPNANATNASGTPLREQIWATYYTNGGDFGNEAMLLFDTIRGRNDKSAATYRAPYDPFDGKIWIVVHDNRAGAAFVELPIHVR